MQNKFHHLPIEDIRLDKLGFREQSERIANVISNFSSHLPYAISINGSWGAGKSTMLNFIENNLNEGTCKVIRFNPWMVSDREELIRVLFEEIYFAIDGGYSNTKEKFKNYAQKIIAPTTKAFSYITAVMNGIDPRTSTLLSNSAGEAAKGISELAFDKPLSKRKQELITEMDLMLGENGQKIVVMIDELDRLFPEEIIAVFQMIKSTLDLPGLFFVVAMDEEIVSDALTTKGISKPEYYLQKIFQRKYYINTKRQIRTLTDHFIIQHLDTNKEQDRALLIAVKAYLHASEDYFIKNHYKNVSDYDQSLGEEWQVKGSNLETIGSSYFKVHKLIDTLDLQNPRSFLNFSEILLDQWTDYYNYVFKEVPVISCYIQTAFLIFISHYRYPNYTEIPSFSHRYSISDSAPDYIMTIRSHIRSIIPVFKSTIATTDEYGVNTYKEKIPDSVIKRSVFYLNKSPDYALFYNL
ncbi:P-loop NTPase fold protein [Bacillus mobilis]|uniref:KAP family P-loop NTPase fold protein n=1 Tax=Bacillus mobilis TaxID=2026190 RepID=UPI002E1D0DAE|nr:P-loop NTPase fold protein [Bacillus mobilis]